MKTVLKLEVSLYIELEIHRKPAQFENVQLLQVQKFDALKGVLSFSKLKTANNDIVGSDENLSFCCMYTDEIEHPLYVKLILKNVSWSLLYFFQILNLHRRIDICTVANMGYDV